MIQMSKRMLMWTILAGLLLVSSQIAWSISWSDNFSSGVSDWSAGSGWSQYNNGSGYVFRCNNNSANDSFAWRNSWIVDSSFDYQADMTFQALYGSGGTIGYAGLAFSTTDLSPGVTCMTTISYSGSSALVQTQYLQSGTWISVLNSGWLSGAPTALHLDMQRQPNGNTITVTLTGAGFNYSANTSSIGATFLNGLILSGFRCNDAEVDFGNDSLASPMNGTALGGTLTLTDYLGNLTLPIACITLCNPGTSTQVFQQFTSLDPFGDYVLKNPPIGTFDIYIRAGTWLENKVANVTINSNATATVNSTLYPGDLNGDNHVNSSDLTIVNNRLASIGD